MPQDRSGDDGAPLTTPAIRRASCRRCGVVFAVKPLRAGQFCTAACYRRQTPAAVFASCAQAAHQHATDLLAALLD